MRMFDCASSWPNPLLAVGNPRPVFVVVERRAVLVIVTPHALIGRAPRGALLRVRNMGGGGAVAVLAAHPEEGSAGGKPFEPSGHAEPGRVTALAVRVHVEIPGLERVDGVGVLGWVPRRVVGLVARRARGGAREAVVGREGG